MWTYVDMTTVPSGTAARSARSTSTSTWSRGWTGRCSSTTRTSSTSTGSSYGYPPEIVDLALATRDIVLTAVRDKYPPFDGSAAPWFDVLRSVTS